MNQNEMNEKLQYIFENINNWLNFAEAKNGALIAINASVIMGIVTDDKIPRNCIVVTLLILLAISLFHSLLSFVPLTGNMAEKRLEYWCSKSKAGRNLYLYSYIAKKYGLNDSEYVNYYNDLKQDAGLTTDTINEDKKYLVQEIIYNSKIVCRKYGLFSRALLFLGLSVIGFVVTMIIA